MLTNAIWSDILLFRSLASTVISRVLVGHEVEILMGQKEPEAVRTPIIVLVQPGLKVFLFSRSIFPPH